MAIGTTRVGVEVFGGVRLTSRTATPPPIAPGERALLGLLIVHRGTPVSADRIEDALWPEESPASSSKIVQIYVSHLRRALGADVISRVAGGYRLDPAALGLDVVRFEAAISEGGRQLTAGDATGALGLFDEALALAGAGEPFGDLAYYEFVRNEAERLEELRWAALEGRFRAALELGRERDVLVELQQAVRAQPLRERLWEALMLALYRTGRQADALEAYQTVRRTLADELGIEPGPRLEDLQRSILQQDSTLGGPEMQAGTAQSSASESDTAVGAVAQVVPASSQPLPGPATAQMGQRESRRTVTILFADLVGSTELGEELDPETLAGLLDRYSTLARRAIDAHGGTIEKFIGDAVMAVFGVPTIREDDAVRAARAALDLRVAVAALSEELARSVQPARLELRIGLNSGEVVAGGAAAGTRLVTGDVVNTAARLQTAAAPGEIILGPLTERLLRGMIEASPAEPLVLKGKSEPVMAHRLLAVDSTVAPGRRPFDTPLIGRSGELAVLRAAFERVATEHSVGVATILGLPGVGKSRLVAELVDVISHDATIARGRCLTYGEGITYWPLREALQRLASIGDEDTREAAVSKLAALVAGADQAPILVRRLATAVGLSDEPAPGEEIPWAVRRTFEHLAATRPVVWIVDDLQWAEPTLLDLMDHIADLADRSSILLVAIARPELAEGRPDWLTRPGATLLRLESLPVGDAQGLVDALAPQASLVVRTRIAAAVEGNPLFAEQLVAHLREEGRLTDGDDHDDLSIPPSIGALLAARLDKLHPADGSVLGRAAVVGRTFWWGAVSTISAEAERPGVGASLGRLVRREFLRPDASIFADDEAYRFRHLLVRDAAYSTLPKRERAVLHERFADWLEGKAGERVPEYAELLGFHLEQAHRYRVELGDRSDANVALGRRAAQRLSAAGRRSFDRGDMPAAAGMLSRATSLLPEDALERLEMIPDLSFAQFSAGRLAESETTLQAGITVAHTTRRDSIALRLEITRAQLALLGDATDFLGPEKVARDAIRIFERVEDHAGLTAAWDLLATACWFLTRAEDALRARHMANEAARRAGDPRPHFRLSFFGAECYGPLPVAEAIPRLEAELETAQGDLLAEAKVRFSLSGLLAMQGRMAESRSAFQRARQIFEELGMRVWAASSFEIGAVAELAGGDPEAAERLLRQGIAELDELGAHGYKITLVSLLAAALQRQGRYPDAIRMSDEALTGAGPDDHFVFMFASAAKAESLAAVGDPGTALAASQIALDHGAVGDFVSFHADALMAHGAVRRAIGEPGAAVAAYGSALAMYEAKGHLPGAARAREALRQLTAG